MARIASDSGMRTVVNYVRAPNADLPICGARAGCYARHGPDDLFTVNRRWRSITATRVLCNSDTGEIVALCKLVHGASVLSGR